MHVPLGTSGSETGQRNMNGKWDRHKLRKNTGRRRLDQHNHGHKQTKREVRERAIDGAHNNNNNNNIQSTNTIVDQAHIDDLQQRNTVDNDGLNHVPSTNRNARKIKHAKNAFTNQADTDSNGNDERNSGKSKSKTMRVTFKLKNGKIAHKIALQRTQYTDNSRHRASNIAGKMKRIDNNGTESVDVDDNDDNDDDDDKILVATGRTKSNDLNGNVNLTNKDDRLNNASATNAHVEDTDDLDTKATMSHDNEAFNDGKNQLHRFKRKSGKAAGALGRPKGGSDSSSKSTSRKKDRKCGMANVVCLVNVSIMLHCFHTNRYGYRQLNTKNTHTHTHYFEFD